MPFLAARYAATLGKVYCTGSGVPRSSWINCRLKPALKLCAPRSTVKLSSTWVLRWVKSLPIPVYGPKLMACSPWALFAEMLIDGPEADGTAGGRVVLR